MSHALPPFCVLVALGVREKRIYRILGVSSRALLAIVEGVTWIDTPAIG